MLMASKYEEIRVEEFCFITDNTYSGDEVCASCHLNLQRSFYFPVRMLTILMAGTENGGRSTKLSVLSVISTYS